MMTDTERVIKGLEWILEDDRFGFGVNWSTGEPRDEYEKAGKIITDTITLLKEQEAVEPIKMQRMDNNFSFFVPYFLCGNCRYELVGEDVMFCAHCGRKVKWND